MDALGTKNLLTTENCQLTTVVAQQRSSPYQEFLAERDEILRHKWIESEKRGCDIGYEEALFDWVTKHRSAWKKIATINAVQAGRNSPQRSQSR